MVLNDAAQSAVTLLTTLTTGASESATGPMNPGNVRAAKGLLFNDLTKVGAVVGYESNTGFLIVRKPDGSWSAPTFVAGKGFSAGITVGFNKASTLVAMFTDKAVSNAQKTFKLGVDFNLSMYPLDFASGKNLDLTTIDTDSVGFGVGKGLIADLSLAGGQLHVDEARNSSVYGAGATPADILASKEAPAEFAPLYEKLREVEARPAVPGQTVPANPVHVGDYQRAL